METKYYLCPYCGNIIEKLVDSGVGVVCCGAVMKEMEANTSDGAAEKHVPDVKVEGTNVQVQIGSVLHPAQPEHYIRWIWLETKQGGQRRSVPVGQPPVANFALAPDDEAVAVFAWCNLHGLWKKDL